jgi:hypothetical protein
MKRKIGCVGGFGLKECRMWAVPRLKSGGVGLLRAPLRFGVVLNNAQH